jgi:hypothetical protein
VGAITRRNLRLLHLQPTTAARSLCPLDLAVAAERVQRGADVWEVRDAVVWESESASRLLSGFSHIDDDTI